MPQQSLDRRRILYFLSHSGHVLPSRFPMAWMRSDIPSYFSTAFAIPSKDGVLFVCCLGLQDYRLFNAHRSIASFFPFMWMGGLNAAQHHSGLGDSPVLRDADEGWARWEGRERRPITRSGQMLCAVWLSAAARIGNTKSWAWFGLLLPERLSFGIRKIEGGRRGGCPGCVEQATRI